jgi:hypothetical protein
MSKTKDRERASQFVYRNGVRIAQTNPYKPPKIEWVQEIVEAADKAGIPVFLKDNLRPLGELIAQFCSKDKWELRQEMPK